MITSRYGSEFGITDWINPGNEKQIGLPKDALTFLSYFRPPAMPLGYSGNGISASKTIIIQLSLDTTFAGIRVGGCPPKDPVMETLDGEVKKVEGYTCDIFTDHTIDFIRENQTGPFLASLHFRAPHAAWLPVRPEDWEPFKDLDPEIPNPDYPNLNIEKIKKQTREYLAAVKSITATSAAFLSY